jgi:hypothetical protein
MNRFFIAAIVCIALFFSFNNIHGAVDGTMGTPIGGIGSGGIRFCGHLGTFYVAHSTPCSMEDFHPLNNSRFMLFTNRSGVQQTVPKLKAVLQNSHFDDDAMYPIYTANFGSVNSVGIKLLAFSPICFDSIDLMCFPYSFFELTLTNSAQTPVEAAIAMQFQGDSIPIVVPGKGLRFPGNVERVLYADSGANGAVLSEGNDSGFIKNGQYNNTINDSLAGVAIKVSLPANGTRTIRFVYAWYNKAAPDRYYYSNFFSTAGAVADVGLTWFSRFRDNATQIVARMRASNFPDWIKDQTLNSLCNLTTNSIFTKDGRHCFTEGMYDVNGTMDQMWHARQIMLMTIPDLVWKELEWWARTQKTDPVGQIHHDMGSPMGQLWGWDDKQHSEYQFEPDCNPWVDLNCAFIISVYEAYCATGNKEKLDYFWPYIKRAGVRIINQVKEYGDTAYNYTFTSSHNTYDQPGLDVNAYNASISTPTYQILTKLCDIYQDATLKKKYQNAFDSVKISFKNKYLSNNFSPGRFTEALLAGQWIGFYLKFGQYYTQSDIDNGLTTMDGYYKPLTDGIGFPKGAITEWAPYLISHFGGLCLQTGRFDRWRALQHDWYERTYLDRNLVFNQQLGIPAKVTSASYSATEPSVLFHYISIPVLWRNYYTMLGYFRNKPTGELWLEPMIPPEMEHSIKNGFFMSPEGFGTISATETGADFANQEIMFKPDRPIAVTALYFRDKSTDSVRVFINNVPKPVLRIGEGYARELKVDFSGTIDSSGIAVNVLYGNSGARNSIGQIGNRPHASIFANVSGRLSLPRSVAGERVSISLYSLTGELIGRKIAPKADIDIRKEFKISNGFTIVQIMPMR